MHFRLFTVSPRLRANIFVRVQISWLQGVYERCLYLTNWSLRVLNSPHQTCPFCSRLLEVEQFAYETCWNCMESVSNETKGSDICARMQLGGKTFYGASKTPNCISQQKMLCTWQPANGSLDISQCIHNAVPMPSVIFWLHRTRTDDGTVMEHWWRNTTEACANASVQNTLAGTNTAVFLSWTNKPCNADSRVSSIRRRRCIGTQYIHVEQKFPIHDKKQEPSRPLQLCLQGYLLFHVKTRASHFTTSIWKSSSPASLAAPGSHRHCGLQKQFFENETENGGKGRGKKKDKKGGKRRSSPNFFTQLNRKIMPHAQKGGSDKKACMHQTLFSSWSQK